MIDIEALRNRWDDRSNRITNIILDKDELEKYNALCKALLLMYDYLDDGDENSVITATIQLTAKYGDKAEEYIKEATEIGKILQEADLLDEYYIEGAMSQSIVDKQNGKYEIVSYEGYDNDVLYEHVDAGIFELILAYAMKPGHFGSTRYQVPFGGSGYLFGRTLDNKVVLKELVGVLEFYVDYSDTNIPKEIKKFLEKDDIKVIKKGN